MEVYEKLKKIGCLKTIKLPGFKATFEGGCDVQPILMTGLVVYAKLSKKCYIKPNNVSLKKKENFNCTNALCSKGGYNNFSKTILETFFC